MIFQRIKRMAIIVILAVSIITSVPFPRALIRSLECLVPFVALLIYLFKKYFLISKNHNSHDDGHRGGAGDDPRDRPSTSDAAAFARYLVDQFDLSIG